MLAMSQSLWTPKEKEEDGGGADAITPSVIVHGGMERMTERCISLSVW